MSVGGVTTVGPITEKTRDRLKEYRDEQDLPHYEAAVRTLLDNAPESGNV